MANVQLPSGIEVRIRQDLTESTRASDELIVDPIITKSGHRVTMEDIGLKGYGKIDPNNPREELISWTGITDNGDTYVLTGVTWGINFHNREGGISENMKRHISGATFSINTDMHYIADNYVNKFDFNVTDNSIGWGDGTTDEDKILEARNGEDNLPFITYRESDNKWLISNDGVNTYDITSGGSGLTAGDGIEIDASAINVKVDNDSAVHIEGDEVKIKYQDDPGLEVDGDGKLGVKVKADTGLIRDADGMWCDSIDPDNLPTNPTDNAHKLPRLNNSGKINSNILPLFGDGSDGDLVIASGTTTINLNSQNYIEKNYESISITGTGKLAFSNPSSTGTTVILKCRGNIVITSSSSPAIDLREIGASKVTTAMGVIDDVNHHGLSVSESAQSDGGARYTTPKLYTVADYPNYTNRNNIIITPGSGGGNGGRSGNGGQGGTGGGAMLIIGAGSLNFTGEIDASGQNGEVGVNSVQQSGGGGGGSGGDVVIAYAGSLISSSGSINNKGGDGGAGRQVGSSGLYGGGAGGAGSAYGDGGDGISSSGTPIAVAKKAGNGGRSGSTGSGTNPAGEGGESDGGVIIKLT